MRNMEKGKNVSMYRSSIKLKPAGPFGGNMVVSMRTILKSQLHQVFVLSAQYLTSHGAPIHIGNPARIGIGDISAPSWGDPTSVEEGEVPVFWACGFSVTEAVKQAGVYRKPYRRNDGKIKVGKYHHLLGIVVLCKVDSI